MTLPTHYLITPSAESDAQLLNSLKASLEAGTRLIQFKGKGMDSDSYLALAHKVVELAHGYQAHVLLSGDPQWVLEVGADGLHLDSKALNEITERPIDEEYLLAISGHDLDALKKGEALHASFAVLSPVKYTKAHPDLEPLGWEGLAGLVQQTSLPIYALGGVGAADEDHALKAGAAGIAGHRGYWTD